jgi:hypothetical protein
MIFYTVSNDRWTDRRYFYVVQKSENVEVPIHSILTYIGSGGKAPLILNPRTRLQWVISFTPRPLYPQTKSIQSPPNRSPVGPQSRFWLSGGEVNFGSVGVRTLDVEPYSNARQITRRQHAAVYLVGSWLWRHTTGCGSVLCSPAIRVLVFVSSVIGCDLTVPPRRDFWFRSRPGHGPSRLAQR